MRAKDFFCCSAIIIVITFYSTFPFIQTEASRQQTEEKMKNYFKEECKSALDAVALLLLLLIVRKGKILFMMKCNGLTRIKRKARKIDKKSPHSLRFDFSSFFLGIKFQAAANIAGKERLPSFNRQWSNFISNSFAFQAFLSPFISHPSVHAFPSLN